MLRELKLRILTTMKRLFPILLIALLIIPAPVLADKPILTINTGGHKAKLNEVIFTSDGKYLVSASHDKTIRVWNTSTGEIDRVLRGHIGEGNDGKIFAAALSPDDRLLAVGGYIGSYTGSKAREEEGAHKIRLINFQTGDVTALLKGHTNVVHSLAFSPDGKRLISGSSDKTVRIWDIRKHKTVHVLKGHTESIYAVTFSSDGTLAASGSDDHTAKLWNRRSGALIRTLKGHADKVKSVAFTPNGKYLISASNDKTIRLWGGRSGKFVKVLASQNRGVLSLAISPDSQSVVSGIGGRGRGGNECRVFSIPSGKKLTSFTKHNNIVMATNISPDGKTAATGGGDDKAIYLWDLLTGKVKHKMAGKGKVIWSTGFARDGRSIAWGMKWANRNLFTGRGPLKQSFQIKSDSRTFELSMGSEISSDSGYFRGIESVGPWSIRTENGDVHKTLEVLKNAKVVHKIKRSSSNGYQHTCLTLTPDGQTMISGAGNGNLTSYNPKTGKRRHNFIGHTGDVWAVASSPDSRLLVSGSSDQTARLWEIETGKLLLTIFQGTDKEWVAWTPEGYYTSSLNGDRFVGWHIDRGEDKAALYYPASRFAKQFYSPLIVAKYLETAGDIDEAIRLANLEKPRNKKVKKTTDLASVLPPAVFFQIPSSKDVTVKENRVRVKAVAKSINKEPITDIWVLVNGRRLDKSRGFKLESKGGKKLRGRHAEISISVPLTQADSRISVIASNRHTQSEPEIINVRWQQKSKGAVARAQDIYKPNLYLLSIGVSKYQKSGFNLDYAHKDAQGLAATLSRQSGKLYRSLEKRVLTDQNATQDDILDGLDWILKESTQKDLAVIFVAGHGLKDDRGNYYFLPHDGDPDKLRRTAVKWFDFQDVLSSLPSKVIFLVDTCHSGSITGKRRGAGDVTDALRELVNAESGVVVMTASTGKESSQENHDWGHGAFTKALIEGLEGKADYDGDNAVDVKELDLFITQRVKALTKGRQHPTTEIPKTMPNFPLMYK